MNPVRQPAIFGALIQNRSATMTRGASRFSGGDSDGTPLRLEPAHSRFLRLPDQMGGSPAQIW